MIYYQFVVFIDAMLLCYFNDKVKGCLSVWSVIITVNFNVTEVVCLSVTEDPDNCL